VRLDVPGMKCPVCLTCDGQVGISEEGARVYLANAHALNFGFIRKINWQDADGKKRVWEAAERKTRGSSGIDGALRIPQAYVHAC
jgi:hypothetical protein